MTIGDWSQTQNFELLIDPRVAADGVTVADLREQFDLNTRISDCISELWSCYRDKSAVCSALA